MCIHIVFRFYVSLHHKPHFRLIGWPVPSSFTRFPFFIVACAMHMRVVPFSLWVSFGFTIVLSSFLYLAADLTAGGLYRLYAPCTFTVWHSLWIQCVLKYSLKSHLSLSFCFVCILNGGRYEYRFRQFFLIKPFLVAWPTSLIHSQSSRWCDNRHFGISFLRLLGMHVSGRNMRTI